MAVCFPSIRHKLHFDFLEVQPLMQICIHRLLKGVWVDIVQSARGNCGFKWLVFGDLGTT